MSLQGFGSPLTCAFPGKRRRERGEERRGQNINRIFPFVKASKRERERRRRRSLTTRLREGGKEKEEEEEKGNKDWVKGEEGGGGLHVHTQGARGGKS